MKTNLILCYLLALSVFSVYTNIDKHRLILTENINTPGHGFIEKSISDGGTITFTPEMRTSGLSDDFILGRMTSAHYGHIKLNSSAGLSNYNTDFYFNSNATLAFDPGYDAVLYGGNPPAFSIYSHLVENNTGTPFTIQALNHTSMYDVTVSLGINASQGQEVIISIIETDMPDEIDIYIEDISNNTFTLLNTSDYTFTADSNLTGTGRFFLRFEGDALSTIESNLNNLNIFSNKNEKTIEITGQLQSETKVILFDINGRVILSNELDTAITRQVIDVSHLNAGIYIIELERDTAERRVQKLIIR